jgi:hypothetical protein
MPRLQDAQHRLPAKVFEWKVGAVCLDVDRRDVRVRADMTVSQFRDRAFSHSKQ